MGRKPKRIYTPEDKLIITGRKKSGAEYVVLKLPALVKDSLKVYSIIHKLNGQANQAIMHLIDKNSEVQTIVKYMKEQQTSAKRQEVIEGMITGEGTP